MSTVTETWSQRRERIARTVGLAVRELRNRLGWSQQELADKSNINHKTISTIETRNRVPSSRTIEKIAKALSVSVSDLGWEDIPDPRLSELTGPQRQVLEFYCRFYVWYGVPPTLREVRRRFGFSSVNGAKGHILALEKKGFLFRNQIEGEEEVIKNRLVLPSVPEGCCLCCGQELPQNLTNPWED
jgi:XRE family transcriptional regulator, regulator of sulfur utilization